MSHSSLTKVLALAAVLAAVSVLFVGAAAATNFGPLYADNGGHYYARVNLSGHGLNVSGGGAAALNATDMSVHNDGTCKAQTDICEQDGYWAGTFWNTHDGLAQCEAGNNGTTCDRWGVYYDQRDIQTYSLFQKRGLGCHEWGHTVGLRHYGGTTDCMFGSTVGRNEKTYIHSKTHVNSRY